MRGLPPSGPFEGTYEWGERYSVYDVNSSGNYIGEVTLIPEDFTLEKERYYTYNDTEISMIPKWLNNQGWIVGWQENGDYMVRMPGGTMIKLLDRAYGISDEDEDGLVTLVCGEYLYKQCYREDPDTGEIIPLPAFERFHLAEDIFQSQKRVFAHGISENGILLLGVSGIASAGISGASEPASEPFEENGEYVAPKVDLAVDNNRDGEIKFDSSDETAPTTPFRFWVNNDADDADGDNPGSSTKNYADSSINGIRDLEDFTRLDIDVSSILDLLKNGSIQLGLKFRSVSDGSPSIKIWKNLSQNGGTEYLFDEGVAQNHISSSANLGSASSSSACILEQDFWSSSSVVNGVAHLLYEGSGEGLGELAIEIHANGQKVGDGSGVWLELRDVKKFYIRGRADWPNITPPYDSTSQPAEPNMNYYIDSMGHGYQTAWDVDPDNTIIFVHGWNQPYENSISFAETSYKRLWHRGFKGKFGMFRWPTLVGLTTYNDSEYRAWKSGRPLKQFVESFTNSKKHIMAHSMGNIVAGSALKQGMSMNHYALLNGAVPASCYDMNSGLDQGWSSTVSTPDSAGELGYRGYLNSVNGNLINFYLASDDALEAWELNNSFTKPVNATNSNYIYDPALPLGQRIRLEFFNQTTRLVTQAHESMSFVAQSQTLAVGAEGRTAGAIDDSINLSLFYGYQNVHSAQWEFSNQNIHEFYHDVLLWFQIFPNPPHP